MDENFDLFGNPVRPLFGQRGRPPYEVTEKDRNKIKLLLALGWSNQRVANALDISLATLKRYFRAELKFRDAMRDKLDGRRLEIAMEQANGGNITALRELGNLIDKSDMKGMSRRMTEAQEKTEDEPRPRKLGKKEAQQLSAETAGEGSEWGDDLNPGLPLN